MIYYAVNKNIDGAKLVNDIEKLFSKYSPDELRLKVLVIKLENINDHGGDSLLPKLTYEEKSKEN
jgi:hypothetical protein